MKRTPAPQEGDIVVARIGTDITLNCFHRPSDDRVELRPCSKNPEHCAIVIDGKTEDWEIVGVVVGAMTGPPRPSVGPASPPRSGEFQMRHPAPAPGSPPSRHPAMQQAEIVAREPQDAHRVEPHPRSRPPEPTHRLVDRVVINTEMPRDRGNTNPADPHLSRVARVPLVDRHLH